MGVDFRTGWTGETADKRGAMHCHSHTLRKRSFRERRKGTRLLCSSLVRIHWQDTRTGFVRDEVAVMEDFAPTGTRLLMGLPVEKDSKVTIAVGSGQGFHGVVQHCKLDAGGYLVGVEFPTEANPAAVEYRPEHFLDVSR